ncbi:AAA family ATPase [Corynebacterium sp. CNJ-954]|uniref:AAA family ATPase n=1 Tax=Corynebacterium sp. CNJ-954 TaxID=1904962 RepID=UPI00096A935F|nr:AAA family ATPase [Corynebacterium sp. CNJ-954]
MISVNQLKNFRNLPQDVLTNVNFSRYNVIYGINDSGKSTICEVLSDRSLSQIKENNTDIENLYVYSSSWADKNLGSFLRGGKAEGVLRIILGEDEISTKDDIEKKTTELKKKEKKRELLSTRIKDNTAAGDKQISLVKDGLPKETRELTPFKGNNFNKRTIRNIFENVAIDSALGEETLSELVDTAIMDIPTLSAFPESPRLWGSMSAAPDLKATQRKPGDLEKNEERWLREGLDIHRERTSCLFCTNGLVEGQQQDLRDRLNLLADSADDAVAGDLERLKVAKEELSKFRTLVDSVQIECPSKIDLWNKAYARLQKELNSLENIYNDWQSAIDKYISNPWGSVEVPELPSGKEARFHSSIDSIHLVIDEINDLIENFTARREEAIKKGARALLFTICRQVERLSRFRPVRHI